MKKMLYILPVILLLGVAAIMINEKKRYIYPDSPWKECTPKYTSVRSGRSASAYDRVINQFDVTRRARYRRTETSTYCNIFSWDVMSAMSVDLPHWVKDGVPADSGTEGAAEMTANATYDWLSAHGEEYGWRPVSAFDAQQTANNGCPAVAVWKNPESGKSGHIMVVRPEKDRYLFSEDEGPVIAQAGAENYNYASVRTVMGDKVPEYYVND